MTIKLNGIGGAQNINNSQLESSKSGKSNENEDKDGRINDDAHSPSKVGGS